MVKKQNRIKWKRNGEEEQKAAKTEERRQKKRETKTDDGYKLDEVGASWLRKARR
jgi:hypothetical protein